MTAMNGGPSRLARPDEIERIREIQRAAGRLFLESPYPEIAEHEPDTAEELAAAQDRWWLWVSVDDRDRPVGALRVLPSGDGLHLRQLDVDPVHAGAKRTAGLVRSLGRFFAGRGFGHLTLTTFADVPWNAPYYERIGFRPLSGDGLTETLKNALFAEAGGYPVSSRVAMRFDF
nr:GNAT family N-acetyltransferase [Nisaea sediminum]